MSDDYAPFPEAELEEMAVEYDNLVSSMRAGSRYRVRLEKRAATLRNALLAHLALRERFLEQTTEMRAALGKVHA